NEQIYAAGLVLLGIVVDDLDFVADMGRGGLLELRQIGTSGIGLADRVMRPRTVPDGNAAVAAERYPILQVQIELAELLFGIDPGLLKQPRFVALLIDRPCTHGRPGGPVVAMAQQQA